MHFQLDPHNSASVEFDKVRIKLWYAGGMCVYAVAVACAVAMACAVAGASVGMKSATGWKPVKFDK